MKEKTLKIFFVLARLIPAAVLFYAGYLKLSAPPEEFAYAIESYKVVPPQAAILIARGFPWFEVYLGSLLFVGLFQQIMSRLAILVFLGFEGLLVQAVIRGLSVTDCGCFGPKHSNSIGTEIALNIVWLTLLAVTVWKKPEFSLDSFWERRLKNEK